MIDVPDFSTHTEDPAMELQLVDMETSAMAAISPEIAMDPALALTTTLIADPTTNMVNHHLNP